MTKFIPLNIPKTKKFGKRYFRHYSHYLYKSSAQNEATRLKKAGWKVRVVKVDKLWVVYKA